MVYTMSHKLCSVYKHFSVCVFQQFPRFFFQLAPLGYLRTYTSGFEVKPGTKLRISAVQWVLIRVQLTESTELPPGIVLININNQCTNLIKGVISNGFNILLGCRGGGSLNNSSVSPTTADNDEDFTSTRNTINYI